MFNNNLIYFHSKMKQHESSIEDNEFEDDFDDNLDDFETDDN